ncbi:MAG: hypothetical protein WCT46_03595 [Candidatus Gracilibacteria bacterium]
MKKTIKITQQSLAKAVRNSSSIEGLSFLRAKKNTPVINLLKKHGRAFSI